MNHNCQIDMKLDHLEKENNDLKASVGNLETERTRLKLRMLELESIITDLRCELDVVTTLLNDEWANKSGDKNAQK